MLINTDTEGTIENVGINKVSILRRLSLEKNVGAFFPQGQSKLSITMRSPY